MQSVGKTKAFLQAKVMPKSHHILLKYVQPAAPGCVGAPAHSGSLRSCHHGRQPRHCGEGHNLCCGWWVPPPSSLLALQGRKGPLQENLLFPSLLSPLFSINETAPSHCSSSFIQSNQLTALLELGQRTTLVSSVSYKVKTKAKKIVYRGKPLPQETLFTRQSVRNR